MPITAWGGNATTGSGQGDLAGTSLDAFVPELWANPVFRYFEKNLVFAPLCDDFSAMIQSEGDTIHIPQIQEVATGTKVANTGVTYTENTENAIDLVVDQHKYAAKILEDIAVIQAHGELFSKYAQSMGYALSKVFDTALEAKLRGMTTDQNLTAANVLSDVNLETVIAALGTNDIPWQDGQMAVVVNPTVYADLLANSRYITWDYSGGSNALLTGKIPSLYGMPLHVSNIISSAAATGTHVGYFFHKTALAFAVQRGVRMQSQYDIDYLGWKTVADLVYGSIMTDSSNHLKGIAILNP
jgi:hypothetical protein